MKIYGLQKTTLLDFPGCVACTVFTGGCNFRCPFCHNASVVLRSSDAMNMGEITEFLEKRASVLDGICISGGEPLMNGDIADFIRYVRSLGYRVKLDTNGSLPSALKALVSEGLIDYVAMDIKNAPRLYAKTAGLAAMDISPIYESVDFLLSDTVDYEFRTTLVAGFHDDSSIRELAAWIRGAKRYFLQGFVDSGDIIGGKLSAVSDDDTQRLLEIAREFIPTAAIRGRE